MNRIFTDYIAASGSILLGMGSALNLGGKYFLYNRAPSAQAADVAAIRQDFAMVGQDITDVLESHPSPADDLQG